MNIKTTIGLGIAVIVLSAGFLIFGRGDPTPITDDDGSTTTSNQPIAGTLDTEDDRSLAHPLTDDTTIQKVVYEKRGKARMVFERIEGDKDCGGPVKWQMVEPTHCEATTWTVNAVVLAATRLTSASKYHLAGERSRALGRPRLRPGKASRAVERCMPEHAPTAMAPKAEVTGRVCPLTTFNNGSFPRISGRVTSNPVPIPSRYTSASRLEFPEGTKERTSC